MQRIMRMLVVMVVALPSALVAQQAVGGANIIHEQYLGVDRAVFAEYFGMLNQKYEGTDATGWGIYFEGPKVAYRLTAVPAESGMEGVVEVLNERVAGFQGFTEAQRQLWSTAWSSRRQSVYLALPELSYLPDDMSIETILANPYSRVMIYHVKPSEMQNFQDALARRGELDRSVGIDNLILRVYRGGMGTPAPVYMLRFHAESQEADALGRAERQAARQGIMEEWRETNRVMSAAAHHVESFVNYRNNELSRRGNR